VGNGVNFINLRLNLFFLTQVLMIFSEVGGNQISVGKQKLGPSAEEGPNLVRSLPTE
jgi:hypothetical protein